MTIAVKYIRADLAGDPKPLSVERVQCEECDLWVPREDICYLAGIQKNLCAECASDHGSEDWK